MSPPRGRNASGRSVPPVPAAGDATLPVDLRTRFDRFPATVKGAFVMRGADGNPHHVRLEDVSIARLPSGPRWVVPTGEVEVDVAPSRDLFVPFEASIAELDPGWYVVASTIRVDGGRQFAYASRPFSSPWPAGETRKGTLRVGRPLSAGGREFVIHRVDLAADSATVVWEIAGQEPDDAGGSPARIELRADGAPLEALDSTGRTGPPPHTPPGERRSFTYPVPRSAGSLSVVIRVGSGAPSAPLEITLP